MPNFDYMTTAVTISGVHMETMENNETVKEALRVLLTRIQEHIECGHLVDIAIDVSATDTGKAVTYDELTCYIGEEKAGKDVDPAPEVYF